MPRVMPIRIGAAEEGRIATIVMRIATRVRNMKKGMWNVSLKRVEIREKSGGRPFRDAVIAG